MGININLDFIQQFEHDYNNGELNNFHIHYIYFMNSYLNKGESRKTKEYPTYTAFDTVVEQNPPSLTLENYIKRVIYYCNYTASPISLLVLTMTFLLLSRITLKNDDIWTIKRNIHRMWISCFLISHKLLDDIHFSNRYIAQVGGIPMEELNHLERVVLNYIDFDLDFSGREGYSIIEIKDMIIIINNYSLDINKNKDIYEYLISCFNQRRELYKV